MMLVLSRKTNESIVINDNIVVTVLEVIGNKIRLGIEAPKAVSVLRSEILNKPEKIPVSKSPLRVTA